MTVEKSTQKRADFSDKSLENSIMNETIPPRSPRFWVWRSFCSERQPGGTRSVSGAVRNTHAPGAQPHRARQALRRGALPRGRLRVAFRSGAAQAPPGSAMAGKSLPPTMSSVGALTHSRAAPARPGRANPLPPQPRQNSFPVCLCNAPGRVLDILGDLEGNPASRSLRLSNLCRSPFIDAGCGRFECDLVVQEGPDPGNLRRSRHGPSHGAPANAGPVLTVAMLSLALNCC